MESRWSDDDARGLVDRYAGRPGCNEDVALRVYTSRLIGREPSLVLHGGGNTSVKTTLPDDLGEPVPVLCVKGSGWDLGDIEPEGLPAVRLEPLLALRERDALSDEEMVNAQRTRLLEPTECRLEHLDTAFEALKRVSPSLKRNLLEVAGQLVRYDEEIQLGERQLIRAFAYALNVPMPPVS